MNDLGAFATPVAEVDETFEVPVTPEAAASTTALTLSMDNAIFLNGAKLDLLPAACYGVGNEPLGREKIGCFEDGTPWRYDPMFAGNDFGTDSHNAHTQPDGAYHYHGDPVAMYDTSGETASGVIGFAADGFPSLARTSTRTARSEKSNLATYSNLDREQAKRAKARSRAVSTTALTSTITNGAVIKAI